MHETHGRKAGGAIVVIYTFALAAAAACDRGGDGKKATDNHGRAPAPAALEQPGAPHDVNAATAPAASAPRDTPSDRCLRMCARSTELNCGTSEGCLSACAAMNEAILCHAEMNAFMDCALAHPASAWECTEQGVAAVKDGTCEAEQSAAMGCEQRAVFKELKRSQQAR